MSDIEELAVEAEEIREAHKGLNKRLDSLDAAIKEIKEAIAKINKAIEPMIVENQFRRRLDDKVTKWLPRVPYLAMIIGAIIYFIVYKTVFPLLNQATGQ